MTRAARVVEPRMVSGASTSSPIQRTGVSGSGVRLESAAPARRIGSARWITAPLRSEGASNGVGWSSSSGMSNGVPSGRMPRARERATTPVLSRASSISRAEKPQPSEDRAWPDSRASFST